ncbi:NACHT domain-containing protein [Halovenus sp. HT40]|uniref:NACHT domain-containing protein n=1 Tax=Halovenus sp. HT40 TaxID=3126691 RepID=UPI00300EB89B
MTEETNTTSDNAGVSASTKRLAGLARGYTFQDVLAGACILSVFFEDANAVAIESKLDNNDKFDDIVLEKSGEKTCLQVKNGPEHRLISSDLSGSNDRGLDFTDLSESAEARRVADEGSRFVVLTSFEDETGSGIEFSDETENLSLFGNLEFEAKELTEFRGGDVEDEGIEFVLGVPGIGTTTDEEEIDSPRNTELFERIVGDVAPRLDVRENPEIDDPESLTQRAVGLARWARNQPTDIRRLEREEIIQRLELIPSEQFPQKFELPDEYIHPRWLEDLEEAYDDPSDRVLVEGAPGSGKSVGIELFHRAWEDSEDCRTLRFYFYIPEDADSLEMKRSDPEWFRHQLAYQIYSTFPEAFGEDTSVPVWTATEDLQEYIDTVAQWANQEDQRILFIFDGLDHALRPFGGTKATESAEGSALEEIGMLDFPDPLGLLMVSREISESHDTLRVDQQIEVPSWSPEEIREYLERRDVPLDDDLVGQVSDVSGGLPVIISHLVTKAEIQGVDIEEVINEASHVDGELEEYYDTIWEPLEPYERDAVTLVALNPTGLREETIGSVIDLPYTLESTRLEDAPLAHILESLEGDRFRVFHDSFRKYTKELLDQEEIVREHTRLFDYLFDQCVHFPQDLDSLGYHAENGPGRSALKDLATLDNLLQWWQKGIQLDHLSNTLDLAFEASLQEGDYITAFDCVILGGVARNMLDIYTGDDLRLTYYAAQGRRDDALRLVDQIRSYNGGSEEALEAMQTVVRNWENELDRNWLVSWEKDHQEAEQPEMNPEAYFEVVSKVLDPEEFWDAAEQVKRLDTGEHLPREVLAAVEKKPELFDSQPEPPEWFFENESVALESCEGLIYNLPEAWCEELIARAPDYSGLSFAALHVLLRCGDVEEEISEVVETRELGEPLDTSGQGGARFNDVYYVGSIVASLVESPEDLLYTVDEIAVEQPKIQKLLALMGAAATRESSGEKQVWVDATLEYLEERIEDGYLLNGSARAVDEIRYWQAVSQVSDAFGEVADQGSEDLVRQVLELSEEVSSGDRFFDTISRSLNQAWEELSPEEALPESLDRRYEELLNRPPMEEPPSRELMDLAVRAARAGYNSRAENYTEKAIERCFRYGYRKDGFLDDVWEGLEDIADGEWDQYLGTAIQLINWANLLHEMTDGKGTEHFEGMFLKSLLDSGAINYRVAENSAQQPTTVRKLCRWRLENPGGMTEDELYQLIDSKEMRVRSGPTSQMELPFFSKAAEVADEFGWEELVMKALRALSWGEYVRDGISDDQKENLRELASEYGVDIPEDLDSENGSSGYETESEGVEPEDERIHEILSQHSEEDPLRMSDFDDLTSEELYRAGDLLQDNSVDSTRYNPTAAAPISRLLAERGNEEQAILLLENVIAERDLINSWLGGGSNRFERVADALLDIDEEKALQSVLNGWNKSRLDTQGYQSIFPQLLWIVKRTEGEIAAEEFFSNVMSWTRRLMWPHQDRIQKWGVLADSGT